MEEHPCGSRSETDEGEMLESSNRKDTHTNQSNSNSDSDSDSEPYVNMEFESEESAKVFYDVYATRLGFVMRVDAFRRSMRDGNVVWRRLVCNKEGFRKCRPRQQDIRHMLQGADIVESIFNKKGLGVYFSCSSFIYIRSALISLYDCKTGTCSYIIKDITNQKPIAIGKIIESPPGTIVHGHELQYPDVKVLVESIFPRMDNEPLHRPGFVKTIGESKNSYVAWPIYLLEKMT